MREMSAREVERGRIVDRITVLSWRVERTRVVRARGGSSDEELARAEAALEEAREALRRFDLLQEGR